ncbi:hypothetical protein H6P81_016709 [Aristolochia fimbriata]|uniref:AT-hook motif nuclear-localized protein n=1 Tax=Aristolochia fimbriata TaxID=158543 RepID=A0AAV7E9H4_ARIFI|nr:hypothetical protein H6P81_016709 [Aristolochia fimbriata]
MEGREGISSPVPAPAVPSESTSQPVVTTVVPPPVSIALGGSAAQLTQVKKKRGRPRKYGPDGTVSLALSPMPISSSAPAGSGMGPGDFSTVKRGRGRPAGSLNKPKIDFDPSGEWAGYSVGGNFTPHVITVAAGEDVTMKIISFSQQGPRAICILSANGAISNVTLHQPDSSGGTLTYEGRFEILSRWSCCRGGVAGLLVAASPVQVVVGSFMPNVQDQKPKRPRFEIHTSAIHSSSIPTAAVPISSSAEMQEVYSAQGQRMPTTPQPTLTPSSSFRADNWGSLHSMPEGRTSSSTDINISLPGG